MVVALLVIVAAFALSHLTAASKRHADSAPKIYIVETLGRYTIILIGLFVALYILGIDITSLTVFAGTVGAW